MLSLKQIVSNPTHFSHSGTPSIIDLVFVSLSSSAVAHITPPIGSSDHQSIISTIYLFNCQHTPAFLPKRKIVHYHKADFDAINSDLSSISWSSILSQDLDSSYSKFCNTFLSIVKDHVPITTVSSHRLPPWLSPPLLNKIKQRRLLFQQAKLNNSLTLYAKYRSLRNQITAEIRKAKSHHLKSISSATQKFWSYVRSLHRTQDSIPDLVSDQSGTRMSSNQDKCNLLNKTFTNFFTRDSTPQTFLPPLNSTSPCSEDLLCSEDTVIDLISSLPLNTSPGPDGIPSILIKATAHSISVPLAHIFNLSISTGVFPSAFKNSTIIPIPKTSPPSSSPSVYHPISLLNLISKLHLFNILLNHLYSTNFLSDSQYGFLPFRSTSSALISATHYILSSLDKGVPQCGVFLDIRKAFDSVNHSLLISKILSLTLPLNITHCLNSYLNNRSQSVKVVDSISFPVPVESGVPQGSILGPLLFIIFVNDLACLPLPTNSKLIMYADDIFLLHPLSSTQDLMSIQLSLNLISNWLSINHLQVNPTKSKFIYFSFKHQSSFDSLPSLKLGNTPISRVYSYKYLGLTFTCTLLVSS